MSILSTLKKGWNFLTDLVNRMMQASPSAVRANLFTQPSLRVDQFINPGSTPGNVGICLSGGGTRALVAGMGQLRALRAIKTSDGRDLISQARAVSVVSGGSWLTVPFIYLQDQTSDDQYLNDWVPDPGRLVLTKTPGHTPGETLDQLPTGNAASGPSDESFGPIGLALQVLLLRKFWKIPTPFLWQTAIALHILKPQGLFPNNHKKQPTSTFSWNEQSRQQQLIDLNPDLSKTTVHLAASGPNRSQRPYLVCNMSMFVRMPNTTFEMLAPVQGSGFGTGIFGQVDGTDYAGRSPGGGAVGSFAFSSAVTVAANPVTVTQTRLYSLMDMVGTSSAFFAEALQNIFASWRENADKLHDDLMAMHPHLTRWIGRLFPDEERTQASDMMNGMVNAVGGRAASMGIVRNELMKIVDEVRDLTPEYAYWPVKNLAVQPSNPVTRFADGGNLENTGLASLFSYEDIDRAIAFVNASKAMLACSLGVFDGNGQEIPGTRILLDAQVPILFGYQPWQASKGYRLYQGDPNPLSPIYQHNQIFPSDQFAVLLQGLWAASGNTTDPATLGMSGDATVPGVNLNPPLFKQTMTLQTNEWFGVRKSRTVTVLWYYLNRCKRFNDALTPDVRTVLGDFNNPASYSGFPNYSTLSTHLSNQQINLMASLTAYSLGNPTDVGKVLDLFNPA